MKSIIGIVVTTLIIVSAYFFISGDDGRIFLRDLASSSMDTDSIYVEYKPLENIRRDDTANLDNLLIAEGMAKKDISQAQKNFTPNEVFTSGIDGIGGHYDENALALEDEVAQTLDQGPIGDVSPNALAPEAGDEFMPLEGDSSMESEPVKK
jgi:hypothetical protein